LIRKFRCIVTKVDEYEIEIDDEVINEEYMKEFRDNFWDYETLKEHAGHLAEQKSRFGEGFMEGYGVVRINGRPPYPYNIEEYKGKFSKEELAINIKVVDEDYDIVVDVEEIDEVTI